MSANKPIKRDPNLNFLSHEHHHGLVFCVRLKKANQVGEKTVQSFVKSFWQDHLKEHFILEEELLLPIIKDSTIQNQFKNEHESIRILINDILYSTKEIYDNAILLSSLIKNHIRFEERIMFPHIETVNSKEVLSEIGQLMNDKEAELHIFQPEFWTN